ncbi:MAG: DUF1330 domain-containing protein [Pseudomonadota bacterium]
MSVILVAQITIHDRERYGQYEAGFLEIFSRYAGTMRAVEEAPEILEGEWPCTRTVLVDFPDREAAMAWYQSDEYQRLAEHRKAASVGNIALLNAL